MELISTRGKGQALEASKAALAGIASDGGLYVPSFFPEIDISDYAGLGYPVLAAKILELFFEDIDRP